MRYQNFMQRFAATGAAFFLVICFFILTAIGLELEYRHNFANLRSPMYTTTEENASLAYRIDATFIDKKQVGILEVAPVTNDAEIPKGISRWLEPGNIAISKSALPYADALEKEFGPVQEIIQDTAVLEDELIVYYRPVQIERFLDLARADDGVYFSSGFAEREQAGALFGDVTHEDWADNFLELVIVVFAFPLLFNLRVMRSSIHETLQNEMFVLQSIGAPWRKLFAYSAKYIAKPYIAGVLGAFLLLLPFWLGYLRVPLTGFRLHTQLYVNNWALLCAWLLLVILMAFGYLAWPNRRLTRYRLNKKWIPSTGIGLGLFAAGVLLSIIVKFTWVILSDTLFLYSLVAVVLLLLAGIPATFAVLCNVVTVLFTKHSNNQLNKMLLGWVKKYPYQASRTGSFAGGFITVGVVLIALFSIVTDISQTQITFPQNMQVVQTALRCVENSTTCEQEVVELIQKQHPDAAIYVARLGVGIVEVTTGKVESVALASFVQEHLISEFGELVPSSADFSSWVRIYTVSQQSSDLLSQIRNLEFKTVLPALSTNIEETEGAIRQIYRQQTTWVALVVIISFTYALFSVWVQFSRDTMHHAREFASIASLTGKVRTIAISIAVRNTLLNLITGVAALLLGIFIVQNFLMFSTTFIPWDFIINVAVVYLIFILAQAILMFLLIRQQASNWRPGKR